MDLCRICGKEKYLEALCSLRDPDLMIELKLEKTFNVKLEENKLLPQQICFQCVSKIDSSSEFLEVLTATQRDLESSLNKQLSHVDEQYIEGNIKMEIATMLEDDQIGEQMISEDPEPVNLFLVERFRTKKVRKSQSTAASSSSQSKTYNRWKGNNPILKVEDIFAEEIAQGFYEETPETLDLDDHEKNEDGRLTAAGMERVLQLGWNNYEWKCVLCSNENQKVLLDSVTSLEEHYKAVHPATKPSFQCMDCRQSFKSYFSFQNHVIEHQPHLKFCCEVCNSFRWNLMELYKHRRDNHTKYRNTCLYCGKVFECGFFLKQHAGCHQKFKAEELFYCDLCDYQAHTKFLIKQHVVYGHGHSNKELICETCGKVCKRLSDMRSHQLVHTEERPYGCDLCDLRFKCKNTLRNHRRTHFPRIMKVECSVCSKKFLTKSKLTRHFRIHTDEFEFTCEYCGRKFKHASGFNTHRRIHTGERPYVCSFEGCGQKFIDWPNMNKHMKNKHSIDNSNRKKRILINPAAQSQNVLM